ncbi:MULTISPECIES: undecaprenyl-phosphate glucose phosphotransferase [Vibrio]|jgi:putative colanic acid biosynthesis UDP-glucose lipid carrier transferase|uniref:UDP-glucose:undecaprenyl-phosphate glucose-1-phosphate transferase n=1 Tax=Vibrio jasicida TaxID=766224 RepID=A0AAU9QQA4_9VIBR|nr:MULTISPECIES: undecaprenyl-phosphate glucose phosphotransferase [Vibrio]KIP76734.1 capsular biosynthesis protein [Vibrio harveyi]MCF6450596.1 undecaprenyl-phosphate glucose phosphotransferase [Vibrio sp. MMG023]MCX2789759.1 undecaprenyl-phosphate glucose phosphotransferase [Vibrio sp. Sgm 5]NOJ19270.1 undecaprenyl-phosphate glucose phosphotransferase [Vibrio jasicida]PAW11724.1 undecaprenyl-phosphate glucose phosphotransferase [Vibrio sp. V1B]
MKHKGLIRSHEVEFAFLYRLIDLVVIVSFMLLLVMNDVNTSIEKDYVILSFVGSISFLIMAESGKLYRSWRTSSFKEQISITCISWLVTCTFLFMVLYFSQVHQLFDKNLLVVWFLLTPILLLSWRSVFRVALAYMRKLGYNTRTAIIIGQTQHGLTLANELENHSEHGVLFDGFYDERSKDRLPTSDYPIKGNVSLALERAKRGEVDYVYIAMPMHANERIALFLNQFSDTTANTYLIPDFFTYNLLHSRWDQIGQVQTLSVFDTPFAGISSWIKRLEDIVLSSIILLLISPVLLAISVGIKLTSKGPIIFKQFRYGLDGRKIAVWKFRSMTTMEQGNDVKQATKNDPRITPFGGFLRRTSLDELPQFINVLQGTMSIVGPRPHAVSHNEEYRQIVDRYMLRHKVKPGITGWAQINGYRGETDTLDKMEKRVEFDLDYIHHWSVWMDLKIIFLTIFKGFTGSNAY